MRAGLALFTVVAASCSSDVCRDYIDPETTYVPPRAPWYEPLPDPLPPARFRDLAAARYHMRQHFDDLRMIEELLIAGKLDEGLTLAQLLVGQPDEPGLEPWSLHVNRVADAADRLVHAPGLDDALRREAQLAVECAGCHVASQNWPRFGPVSAPPPDGPRRQDRMARHVWAVDRLWESLVGADDVRWTRGLEVLAATPLPFPPTGDPPQLAIDLQAKARAQLANRTTTLLDERGTAYGEMLVTCAACHASTHAKLP